MPKEHEIVFEDLHGTPDEEHAVVDLDADSKDSGISRFSDDESEGERAEIDLSDGQDDDDADGDDASQRAGADDKDSKGGEGDGYSKKVKARIQRATRAEKKAKEEADYWKNQASTTQKQLRELRKKQAESTVERVDSEIEAIEQRLEAAHEGGETKEVVKLTSRLSDLKADKYKAQNDLETLDSTDTGNDSPDSGKVQGKSSERDKLVEGWMGDNDDWYGARGFERQTRVANRIDKEVFDDGYDPNTPEYYEELTARIKAKLPDLFDDDTGSAEEDPPPTRKSSRSPVAPVGRSESASTQRRSSSSRVELNEQDFANMRRFGLDTNDPAVLKEYAQNKREAEKSALRQ